MCRHKLCFLMTVRLTQIIYENLHEISIYNKAEHHKIQPRTKSRWLEHVTEGAPQQNVAMTEITPNFHQQKPYALVKEYQHVLKLEPWDLQTFPENLI